MLADLTEEFVAGRADPAAFGHRDHIRVAHDLLKTREFDEALAVYAREIRALAARAGASDKFNMTITCAFLSLIAERLAASDAGGFEAFLDRNPDLLDRGLLGRWYTAPRMQSALARRVFLMPDLLA